MAALFLKSTSSSEEKAFLDLVTATAESSVPSQSGDALPASWTPSLPKPCPSEAQAASYLPAWAGAVGLRHFKISSGKAR